MKLRTYRSKAIIPATTGLFYDLKSHLVVETEYFVLKFRKSIITR